MIIEVVQEEGVIAIKEAQMMDFRETKTEDHLPRNRISTRDSQIEEVAPRNFNLSKTQVLMDFRSSIAPLEFQITSGTSSEPDHQWNTSLPVKA